MLPPRPEAYPIPTQTYTREYFTFPASKSQDRMGPTQSQWSSYEEKPQVQTENNHYISTAMQVRNNVKIKFWVISRFYYGTRNRMASLLKLILIKHLKFYTSAVTRKEILSISIFKNEVLNLN